MKRVEVEIDGRAVRGYAQRIGDVTWAHAEGETFVYEPPSAKKARRGGGRAVDPGQIASPMPGKVIKTYALPGEAVPAGQPIVTLEAMKMEYSLKAQADGVLKELKCKAGDQVALGQILAVLETPSGK